MKFRPLLVLAALSLAACATTPTVYQPATGPGVMGYVETPIEHDRWRVSFRGAGGTDIQRVSDLALRRAAELTLAKGYDWFCIVGRDASGAPGGVRPNVSFGFGGADFGGASAVGAGAGVGFDLSAPRPVTVTLEVLMAHGPTPRQPDTYDAREVLRSFGART